MQNSQRNLQVPSRRKSGDLEDQKEGGPIKCTNYIMLILMTSISERGFDSVSPEYCHSTYSVWNLVTFHTGT